ncbi:MAG: hypothetical protein ACU84Q_04155 [Gammaproteobacteria bacterium]
MVQLAVVSSEIESEHNTDFEVTVDLAVLAQVNRGDRIEIDMSADKTLELFGRTLKVVEQHGSEVEEASSGTHKADKNRFVPEHRDLRQRFIFAETLGSYSTLHDLMDQHSPAYRMSQTYSGKVKQTRLTEPQIRALEEYRTQIHEALLHANQYLLENANAEYSTEELHELNEILTEAKERFQAVTAILGVQLIHDVEDAVRKLYGFQEKMRTVSRSIDGIFMVDSEVMFIPTNELVKIVNDLFKAVGNPYVAENIDGMLLLAARNLLIESVSFYSYYGKEQIYRVFRRGQATVSRAAISHQIRGEIKKLFRACTVNNKLVLRRMMASAEREFEISIEAIQSAAEMRAIEVVNKLIPEEPPAPPPPPPTLMTRLKTWLFR